LSSEDFSNIVNWKNLADQSLKFKNQKPFSFGFIEDFFDKNFYEKLYKTFPKIDENWGQRNEMEKTQYYRTWNNIHPDEINKSGDDANLDESWNKLKRYAESDEFVKHFRDFSGVPVSKCKHIFFMSYKRGGFQLPHIHNVGPSTIEIVLYFSKGWQKGDPGGTYMASEPDESSIIFEPYNLDNSIALFHDGPKAAHGVRYITKDVIRSGLLITLEGYSEETGWSCLS
tara:strand:+ start:723 stop:1406 length:684 start_codon:yes stop_codon:yes gene_type:complete